MPVKSKVMIIGDSISGGYTPHVQRLLADRYEVTRHGERGDFHGVAWHDSRRVLAKLDDWLAKDPDAVLIHCNCGLHDIMVDRHTGQPQVTPENYRENLVTIVARLKATGKRLIWATTTPVLYERHLCVKDFDRHQEAVEAYNRIALEIVTSAGIAVNDLHAAVCKAGAEKCLRHDGVHMTPEADQLLGNVVARAISRSLKP